MAFTSNGVTLHDSNNDKWVKHVGGELKSKAYILDLYRRAEVATLHGKDNNGKSYDTIAAEYKRVTGHKMPKPSVTPPSNAYNHNDNVVNKDYNKKSNTKTPTPTNNYQPTGGFDPNKTYGDGEDFTPWNRQTADESPNVNKSLFAQIRDSLKFIVDVFKGIFSFLANTAKLAVEFFPLIVGIGAFVWFAKPAATLIKAIKK